MDGVDNIIPVNAYIPGCPPRPEAIIDGLVKLLGSLANPALPERPIVLEEEKVSV
jgi:NAD(P)H-quinone oxidoreductase subunit K